MIVLLLVWGVLLIYVRVRHPGLELGDGLNDADILHASRWFEEHGYRATAFLPVRETAYHPDFWPPTYNTFPPGVFYLHEVLKGAGLRELWQFRIASIAIAMWSVWLWFASVRRMTGAPVVALLSAAMYMAARPVLSYAPGMWEHVPMLSLFGTMYCWLRHEQARTPGERALWLCGACAANFFDAWLTLQHSGMIGVFVFVRAAVRWWWGDRTNRNARGAIGAVWGALLVGLAPIFVAALRFGQQVLYAGSVQKAIDYFRGPLTFRLGEERFDLSRWQVVAAWAMRLGAKVRVAGQELDERQVLYPVFGAFTLACLGVLVLSLARYWREAGLKAFRQSVLGAVLLMGAAMTWPLLMKQHAYMHAFPVLMFLPGATLLLGGMCAWGVELARRQRTRVVAGLVAGIAIAPLIPALRHARWSDTLNREWRLDHRVHERLNTLAGRYAAIVACAPALRAHPGTLRIVPRQPAIAWMLDHHFYQLARPLDMPWVGDEVLAIDLSSHIGERTIAPLSVACGLPDFSGSGGEIAFVPGVVAPFRSVSECLGEGVAPGAVLREIRVANTVDKSSGVVSVLIEGPLNPREAGQMAMFVRLIGAGDEVLFSSCQWMGGVAQSEAGGGRARSPGVKLGQQQDHSEAGLVAWMFMPRSAFDAASRVEVAVAARDRTITRVISMAERAGASATVDAE